MRRVSEFKRFLVLFMAVCVVFAMSGCSKKSDTLEDASGLAGVTTSFEDDTVFTVADRRVSLTEWNLYALSKVAQIESMYGNSIWNYSVDTDGATMSEKLKEDIKDQIVYVKTISSQAERLGITINEDEQIDINIQTEEFLSKLTEAQKVEYAIDADAVKAVLTENQLAMKVYENLTLNIDTAIPDEEVRHMVLEYIMVPKTYEDEKTGDIMEYSAEELAQMKAEAENFMNFVKSQGAEATLSELNEEEYSVVTMIADYAELKDKFPAELAGIAFNLRQYEIDGLYETDAGFFVLQCVSRTDEKTTNAARVKIIEERQKALFESEFKKWQKEVVVKYNYHLWDDINLHP